MMNVLKKVFGSSSSREVKRMKPIVARINALEVQLQSLSDDQLKAKTDEFRGRLQNGETVDDLMEEAFAVVKNACRRMCGTMINVRGDEIEWVMVPFDVQIMGAIVLHTGGIAELQTGEGKTLVATMPLYLNGLTGRNCQLVTVNDFLARRDMEWCGSVLRWLGLTTGCIENSMRPQERRQQYECNVTYGTNSEFGFDYLRDMGMASDPDQLVQRDYYFCIIDEVDSILIDEARTPLIISGPVSRSTHKYDQLKPAVESLYRKQMALVTDLIAKAKVTLEGGASPDDEEEAIHTLVRARLGMPKHKQLNRMLEDPDIRRRVDKADRMVHSDQNRGLLQDVKNTLYYTVDEKQHDADLSELGRRTLRPDDPDSFVLPDLEGAFSQIDLRDDLDAAAKQAERQRIHDGYEARSESIHNISQLLRAYTLYEQNVQYIVVENKVVIVDENTGHPMPGRRFSDGLHQALEAKENVTIERETQTLATVTIQNYFRMYEKLAGMTGTAETEAAEFKDIYKLKTVVVPTNRPCLRDDLNDRMFKTKADKYRAIIEDVRERHDRGQPILLGTISVEVSEVLSRLLKRAKVPHNVLNAKYHQQESQIVAAAGQRGAVTIATNMAGRGTDIRLGIGVQELGGLHVIGSERHDSRRIDRQLRGRCARQGDPGSSQSYVSLEDDLMRLFVPDRMVKLLEKMGMEEGEEMSMGMLTKTIETAQRRVEQQHFSVRKRTLQYDDVMNRQREVIYGRRHTVLRAESARALLFDYVNTAIFDRLAMYTTDARETGHPFNREAMLHWLNEVFPVGFTDEDMNVEAAKFDPETFVETMVAKVEAAYAIKEENEDPERLPRLERHCVLEAYDRLWQDHLFEMDSLRQSVHMQVHAQKDPLVEYKRGAFELFGALITKVNEEVAHNIFRWTTQVPVDIKTLLANMPQKEVKQAIGQFDTDGSGSSTSSSEGDVDMEQGEMDGSEDGDASGSDSSGGRPARRRLPKGRTYVRGTEKIGNNDPCPCGSGKKYKKCHGRLGA